MSVGDLFSVSVTEFDTAIGRCAMAWTDAGIMRFQLPEVVSRAAPDGSDASELRQAEGGSAAYDLSAITAGMLGRGVDSLPADRTREAEPTGMVSEAVDAVRGHLTGELDDLRWIPLDYRAQPEFHRAVYDIIRTIAPGRTLTYGKVAAGAGAPGAAQAVGQALGRNPIPLIVPCHRVLAADHGLHGFSAPGGIATKARLLEIERTPGYGEPTLF